MTSVLKLENINFFYGQQQILEDINLHMYAGDFAALIGPNGGGKTTLIKIILGLLNDYQGRVEIFGKTSHKPSEYISYVPQYANFNRNFPISVLETVLQGRLNDRNLKKNIKTYSSFLNFLRFGQYCKQDYKIAEVVMRETFTWTLKDKVISELSGGQLQRVMVARALAGQPKILLLDEPTANIDERSERDIFDLFKKLNQRMTIMVISHDIGFVSAYVNKVFCLNKTLLDHQPQAVDNDSIRQLYGDNVLSVHHHSQHCSHH